MNPADAVSSLGAFCFPAWWDDGAFRASRREHLIHVSLSSGSNNYCLGFFSSTVVTTAVSTVRKLFLPLCWHWGFRFFFSFWMGFCLCLCITATEPAAQHACPKPHMRDCSGQAASLYDALLPSLQRVKEALETCMTKPLPQDVGDQMGQMTFQPLAKSGILGGTSLKKYGRWWDLQAALIILNISRVCN